MARLKQTAKRATSHTQGPGKTRTKKAPAAGAGAGEAAPRRHRRRASTVALREIRKQQKCFECLLLKMPFSRLVKEITSGEVDWSMSGGRYGGKGVATEVNRWETEAMDALREGCQDFLVDVFRLLEAAFRMITEPHWFKTARGVGSAHLLADARIKVHDAEATLRKARTEAGTGKGVEKLSLAAKKRAKDAERDAKTKAKAEAAGAPAAKRAKTEPTATAPVAETEAPAEAPAEAPVEAPVEAEDEGTSSDDDA
jgi:histone H3/H4